MYDYVGWAANGTRWLEYTLKHPTMLSEADLYLWDGPEATPRTYNYRIDVRNADTGVFTTVASNSAGRSWNRHFFAPIRADEAPRV